MFPTLLHGTNVGGSIFVLTAASTAPLPAAATTAVQTIVAMDVPIGFGPREADAAARTFMKGAASVVFSTPSQEILETPFGPGLGVSAQAHALGKRIVHVTQLANSDSRLREVHPE